jgi:hypothetical protein
MLKDIEVAVPMEKTDHKQKIIIGIDISGSQSENRKQEWIATILLDRLRYVMKGEAELIIFGYERQVFTDYMWFVNDKESAIKFWKEYSYRANLGDTSIGNVLKQVYEEVQTPGFFGIDVDYSDEEYRPEILILTDGL